MTALATMPLSSAIATTFLVILGLLGVVMGVFLLVNPKPPRKP